MWQAWTAPAARAVWAAPTPAVTVEFLEAETRVGGREVSLCKVEGRPDIRCECGWLALQPTTRSVNYEVVSSERRHAVGGAGDGGLLRHGTSAAGWS